MTLQDYVHWNNDKLFDFNYYFFDVDYKERIENLVYDYYEYRQIAIVPPERWRKRFKVRWELLIHDYNQKYETTLIKFNPLLTESYQLKADDATRFKQLTDYASALDANNKQKDNYIGQHYIVQTGDLNTDTTSHQDDENNTVGNTTEKTLQSEQGTLDKQEDTTQKVTTTDDTQTDRTTNTDTTVNSDGTKNVKGESNRVNNTVTDGTTSEVHNRYDYPQNQVVENPPNQGGWITWKETRNGTTHGETDTTEDITSNEDTTTHDTTITDEGQVVNEIVERDITENTTKGVTTNQNTTDELQKNVITDTTKDYTGTIDNVGNIKTITKDTDKLKESNSKNIWISSESNLATAETRNRDILQHSLQIVQGFRNISQSQLLQEFRSTIINYDEQLIDELEILFMGVW